MDKLYLGVGREIITPEVGGHLFGYNPNIVSESIADDLTVTAFPLETFSEIEMRIDKYVKDATVLVLNQCNGNISYFATHTEIPRGGYEVNSFMYSKDRPEPYCDHADFELIKATVNNINSLMK